MRPCYQRETNDERPDYQREPDLREYRYASLRFEQFYCKDVFFIRALDAASISQHFGNLEDPGEAMTVEPKRGGDKLDGIKRQSLIDYAHSMNDFSASVFKWTLGALLVANGGAILAVLNSEDLRQVAFSDTGVLFGSGLFLAIVAGFCWTFGLSAASYDLLRRAWNPEPLKNDDFETHKPKGATVAWVGAGLVACIASFVVFALGCLNMSFVPDEISWRKARQNYTDATDRFVAEVEVYSDLSKDPKTTPAELQTARDRVNSARIDAVVAGKRADKAFGEKSPPSNTNSAN